MSSQQPRFSAEETARRGDEIYEQSVRPLVERDNIGKVVAVDIETGDYALGEDALVASDRLLTLRPDAEVWLVRVGHRALHHIRARPVGQPVCR